MHSAPAVKATSYVAYFAPIRSHTFCFGLTHTTEMKNNNATSTFYRVRLGIIDRKKKKEKITNIL
jgi:hypothetical protein